MIWDFTVFFLGAALATGICWYLWKSTAEERAALKAKIQRLEDEVTNKFKSS